MVLVRKVAAVAHALRVVRDGTVVVWVDVDVVVGRALDDGFLDFVRSRDVCFVPETVCWAALGAASPLASSPFQLPERCQDFRADTGVVALVASDATRAFADWWLGAYAGPALAAATRCLMGGAPANDETCAHPTVRSNLGLNDVYTFALSTWAFRDRLRFGWFAEGSHHCRSASASVSPSGAGADADADRRLPGGHCYPCPARPGSPNANATRLVSPFNVGAYFYHVKGGHGPMSRQHAPHRDAPRALTDDAELALPAEHFPARPAHVDHRMACGDKRAAYGRVWSLRQL